MACFWKHFADIEIRISNTQEIDTIIFYKIEVKVHTIHWTVLHRYREFFKLHQVLCNDHGVSKHILPPKRTIRNKCPDFIEERRQALQVYLQKVFHYLKRTMPKVFVEFLNFHVYDTFYLLKHLAFEFCSYFHDISTSKSYTLNPVELYAIHICFEEPFPSVTEIDSRYDLSHVLDVCSQLLELIINGKPNNYSFSNIEPNKLPLDFSPFKSLRSLLVQDISLDTVCNLGNLRSTLQTFALHQTTVQCLSQILLCDVLHKSKIDITQVWAGITHLDLSFNAISGIDKTINLVPNVTTLNLSHNNMDSFGDFSGLIYLTHLYLAGNLLSSCVNLHNKLGNIVTLDLAQNKITSLHGFSKLYSLKSLNLSSNNIHNINELNFIGGLPCLNNLLLTGNKVATLIDYRSKVLEYFNSHAKDICLDNEKPTQNELDKAALFKALTIVKNSSNS